MNYNIIGYSPPLDDRMGGYGFLIQLDPQFALKAKAIKFEPIWVENLNKNAKVILQKFFNSKLIIPPYHFLDDTALLRFCQVPGDACDLGICGQHIEYIGRDLWVEYNPHNVDTAKQAFMLLSLWIHWYEIVETLISDYIGDYMI